MIPVWFPRADAEEDLEESIYKGFLGKSYQNMFVAHCMYCGIGTPFVVASSPHVPCCRRCFLAHPLELHEMCGFPTRNFFLKYIDVSSC